MELLIVLGVLVGAIALGEVTRRSAVATHARSATEAVDQAVAQHGAAAPSLQRVADGVWRATFGAGDAALRVRVRLGMLPVHDTIAVRVPSRQSATGSRWQVVSDTTLRPLVAHVHGLNRRYLVARDEVGRDVVMRAKAAAGAVASVDQWAFSQMLPAPDGFSVVADDVRLHGTHGSTGVVRGLVYGGDVVNGDFVPHTVGAFHRVLGTDLWTVAWAAVADTGDASAYGCAAFSWGRWPVRQADRSALPPMT